MIQLVALLITAGLVVGGLLEGGFIGDDEDNAEGAAVEATTDAAAGAAPGGQGDKAKADGGKQDGGRKRAASSRPRVEVFCVTSRQLDEFQTGFLEGLEQQTDATPQELQAVQREFVVENRSLFDELQQVAPPAIRADVGTRNAATLAQAGVGQAPTAKEQRAAEQRIEQFEQKNC